MKKALFLLLLCSLVTVSLAQSTLTEQLQQIINAHPQRDSFRVNRLNELVELNSLPFKQEEKLCEEALAISREIGDVKGEAYALVNLRWIKKRLGDNGGAIEITQQADAIAKKVNDPVLSLIVLVLVIVMATVLFHNNRQRQKANVLLQNQKLEIDKKAGELAIQKDNLERSYNNVEQLGEIGRKIISSLSVETIIATVYDNVNAVMDAWVFGIGIYDEVTREIEFLATYENRTPLPPYSISINDGNRFAALCFLNGREIVIGDLQIEYKKYLQNFPVPEQGEQPVSLIYLPLKVKEKTEGVITVQSFRKNAYSNYQLYMLRNIANYAAIALENAESNKKLTHTLESLRKTQVRLIQSEKMASLGELTAGIAHEIQNPLNFVNNFSELNRKLIREIKGLLIPNESKLKSEQLDELLNNLEANEKKLIHHGKRANAIVKGMLQHSRVSTGQKEPTNINALSDEYLRLSHHGMRAKDKSFNTTLQTNFDTGIDKVNIVQQDVGSVLLNRDAKEKIA